MNRNKFLNSTFFLIITMAWLSSGTEAQTATGQPVEAALFGMQRLSPGQSVQVSVVSRHALSDGEIIPCVRVRVMLEVYEINSPETIRPRFLRRIERDELLEPGQALSLNFPTSRTGDLINVSVFLYRVNETDPPEPIRRASASTMQVLESGRVLLAIPALIKGFDPQPDPPNQP